MTDLSPGLDAALSADVATIFGAIAIDLPGGPLSLLDGAGQLVFGGRTFVGIDPTFGALVAMESLADGVGDEAPRLSITLAPSGDAAAATLAGPGMQGSLVAIYEGAIIQTTGQVVPDPHLLFVGELDVPVLTAGDHSRELEYEVASLFERFFEEDEGVRLASGYHQSVWPGELGLDFVTETPQGVYWGVEAPRASVTPTLGGASGRLPGGLFGRQLGL